VASSRPELRSLTLGELGDLVAELGQPAYRAEQLFRWLHGRRVRGLDEMANVPGVLREALAERATLANLSVDREQLSTDGTRKLRLLTADGRSIETVLIPDGEKLTQCISSQVGCALDCQFCATAKLGLMRNLEVGEIADQVYLAQRHLADVEPGRRITNLVYMGMGEPLHNFDRVVRSIEILTHELGANLSHRRITVSTVGLVPAIARLGRLEVRPNLAISLNATTDAVRDEIMPINKRFPIASLLDAARAYPLERRRRITFEYVMLAEVNDTDADAERLGRLLGDIRCKVNLIPWNPHPGAPYARPSDAAIDRFQGRVKAAGLPAYLRTPRGDDIDAACGQLANRTRAARARPTGV
jgi:23S rRNA (adenine2503-C2)-methyltransferase